MVNKIPKILRYILFLGMEYMMLKNTPHPINLGKR